MNWRTLYRSLAFSRTRGTRRKSRAPVFQKFAVEKLEERHAPVTLSNGAGDGSVQITVDSYGSFGAAAVSEGFNSDAIYDPFGNILPSGTTFESGFFFGPANDFLTTGTFGNTVLAPVPFTSTTSLTALSEFDAGLYHIQLLQELSPVGISGSTFTQTYTITNNTGSFQAFTVLRHLDGDIYFDGSLVDYGGADVTEGILYEFDGDPSAVSSFVGISATGGSAAGYTIQPFRYTDDILGAGGIPAADLNLVNGDNDADFITDFPYDITLSLQNTLTVPAGGSVVYVTETIFGEVGRADLSISKSDSPDPVLIGNDLAYSVSVVNRGPGEANNVVMIDTLPAGVTFVSATSSQGTCTQASGTVTCLIGTLAPGDAVSITITVTPTIGGILTNTATIAGGEVDFNTLNNTATTVTSVSPADISILITDSPDPVILGGDLTYTMTVTNDGPAIATDVTVTNQIPGGTVFVDADSTQGTCSVLTGTLTCALGSLNAGASATITLIVTPSNEGIVLNISTVTGSGYDPNTSNNSITLFTTVLADAGPPGTFLWDVDEATIYEFSGNATITVRRSGGSGGTVTIAYTTTSGSAIAGLDFTTSTGVLTFLFGETTKTINVPILNDTLPEGSESLILTLSNPTGGAFLDPNGDVSRLTILDDDSAAQNTLSFTDSDGDIFTVKLSGLGTASISLNDPDGDQRGSINTIALAGTDAKSALSVLVKRSKIGDGKVSIQSITGASSLKSIRANRSDIIGTGLNITGNATLTSGGVEQIIIGDVRNGADIFIGGNINSLPLRLTAGIVAEGSSIAAGRAIRSILLTSMLGDVINTPHAISLLQIRANKDGVGGILRNTTIAAQAIGQIFIEHDISDARILAGTFLGADNVLGGIDDTFAPSQITRFAAGGPVVNAVVGAGLSPVDGIFDNGNDIILGGPASFISSFLISGPAGSTCYFAAGSFPPVVSINGVLVNPATDPRFFVG